MKEIKDKFEESVINNIDKQNAHKILSFLVNEKCDFIEDIISDYLDLFTFDYEEFVNKYTKLNEKYNGEFLKEARANMDLLEEFYY